MTSRERSMVVGVFEDRRKAEEAVGELERMGFAHNAIGYVRRGETHEGANQTKAGEMAGGGAVVGGVAGGLIGAAAAGVIPGIGPVIAAGILASTLLGAAAGATAGGLIGALIGAGIPEEEAQWYENELRSGRAIVTVRAGGRNAEAAEVLRRHGAYDIERRGTTTGATTTATAAAGAAGAVGASASSRAGAERWEDVSASYQDSWKQRFGTTGSRWEEHEPYYRWAWERRNEVRFRGRAWSDIEPEFRRDWATQHPNSPWERVKEGVRAAWESVTRHGRDREHSGSVRISEIGTDMSERITVAPSEHRHRFENNRCIDCGEVSTP